LTKEDSSRKLAVVCAREAYAMRGDSIVVYDLRGLSDVADYFVIACGTNRRQLKAMANGIEEASAGAGERAIGVEGLDVGNWILLDFGDVVVHLFLKEVREYYGLDMLWGDAPVVKWEDDM